MLQEQAWMWGLCASSNPMNMAVDRISRKNGMVNGFAYGYRVRHDELLRSLYCSPTEDVERSCRLFKRDGILLRYQMYCARTIFKAPDGINLLYEDAAARKSSEEKAIEDISAEFPELLAVRQGSERRKTQAAMNFKFRCIGRRPLDGRGQEVAVGCSAEPSAEEALDPAAEAAESKRAAIEKVVMRRCIALQDHLDKMRGDGTDQDGSEETRRQASSPDCEKKKPSGETSKVRVPAFLDEVVKTATRDRKSLEGLGIKAVAAEQTDTEEDREDAHSDEKMQSQEPVHWRPAAAEEEAADELDSGRPDAASKLRSEVPRAEEAASKKPSSGYSGWGPRRFGLGVDAELLLSAAVAPLYADGDSPLLLPNRDSGEAAVPAEAAPGGNAYLCDVSDKRDDSCLWRGGGHGADERSQDFMLLRGPLRAAAPFGQAPLLWSPQRRMPAKEDIDIDLLTPPGRQTPPLESSPSLAPLPGGFETAAVDVSDDDDEALVDSKSGSSSFVDDGSRGVAAESPSKKARRRSLHPKLDADVIVSWRPGC
eukprot:TRINITY_DN44571_c0_g1_i1.p2 TRINITY_DN44571_c0_g1~~TRINITY_DN44571_c0_g1_i1.p2  ORF type:complete len:539 (-),score=174.32 TRINITY_DN44571_c0_g1_i1:123-1739(-)